MYFKIILISIAVFALWCCVIQPLIEEAIFEWKMKKDDEEQNSKKESQYTLASYHKKYFPVESPKLKVMMK